MKKQIIIVASVLIATSALASAYLPSTLKSSPLKAEAQTPPTYSPVSGFLWSSNVGWIKLDPTGDTTKDVRINDADGNFAGYAWSSGIGWINFAPDVADAPALVMTNRHGVKVTDTNVTGLARACSVFVTGCSGNLKPDSARGSWDGWIEMRNVILSAPDDSHPEIKKFVGYAWGDLNVGWVDFGLAGITGSPTCTGPCGGGGYNVTCTASPNPATSGAQVTLIANTATAGVSYEWSGDLGSASSSDVSTLNTTYSASTQTTYHPMVRIKKDGTVLASATCGVGLTGGGVIITPPSPVVYRVNCQGGKVLRGSSLSSAVEVCNDQNNQTLSGISTGDTIKLYQQKITQEFTGWSSFPTIGLVDACTSLSESDPCEITVGGTSETITASFGTIATGDYQLSLGVAPVSTALSFTDDNSAFPRDGQSPVRIFLQRKTLEGQDYYADDRNPGNDSRGGFDLSDNNDRTSPPNWADDTQTGGGRLVCGDNSAGPFSMDNCKTFHSGDWININYLTTSTRCPSRVCDMSAFTVNITSRYIQTGAMKKSDKQFVSFIQYSISGGGGGS